MDEFTYVLVENYDDMTSLGYGLYVLINLNTQCDGSTCPATDPNGDNICDDCGKPFTMSLRNDTYNFNGTYLPSTLEMADGSTMTIHEFWDTATLEGSNMVLLTDDTLYYFSTGVEYSGTNVVTKGLTVVMLWQTEEDENGNPYWDWKATDTWKTPGANVGARANVTWVADDVYNTNGFVSIDGDVNFLTPLWERVEQVTQGNHRT